MNRVTLLALAIFAASGGARAFDEDAARGRALYQGHAGFAHGLEATANRLPGAFAACARCHGSLGEGGREGGVAPPPLAWTALMSPRADLPAFGGDEAVLSAVTEGRARNGNILSAAMPRYRLTDAEKSSLLGYLRILGGASDLPPGVSHGSVRLGALLPLTGADAAVGDAVLAGLRDVLEDVNSRGGVYGRRLDLVIADRPPRGALPAAQELLARHPYALVAGMWDEPAVGALFSQGRVAKIGSLAWRDHERDLDEWDADLFAPRNKAAAVNALPCGQSEAGWRMCGQAAAALTVELLSRAGAALHERALIAQLPRLNGTELVPGAPARFSKTQRYAFDREVTENFTRASRNGEGRAATR